MRISEHANQKVQLSKFVKDNEAKVELANRRRNHELKMVAVKRVSLTIRQTHLIFLVVGGIGESREGAP